jgi:Fic family protein
MSEKNVGRYIQVGRGVTAYRAYIPSKLGENLPFELDLELVNLLGEANRYIGKLDEITNVLIAPGFFVKMFARKEAALSSQIEGTQATFSDLLKREAGIESNEIPSDVKEIENYLRALDYGISRLDSFPISLRLMREVHKILLHDVRGTDKNPGEFRLSQNWIGGRSINTATYIPPPVDEMNEMLDNFEKFIHQEDQIHHLIKAAIIHAQLEMIHPFLDGNGRIGRLLITFYLNNKSVISKPTLYLSKYFKRNRKTYYECLLNISEKNDLMGWIKFFLEGIVKTSKEGVDLARRINELKEKDVHKIQSLGRSTPKADILLMELFSSPIISIDDVCKIVDLTFPNAQKLINRFIDLEILYSYNAKKRNKLFFYQNYMDILLED